MPHSSLYPVLSICVQQIFGESLILCEGIMGREVGDNSLPAPYLGRIVRVNEKCQALLKYFVILSGGNYSNTSRIINLKG